MSADDYCDRCVRLRGPLKWHPIGQGMNYLCEPCIARDIEEKAVASAEERCGNCDRLTSDIHPIDFGRSGVWNVCGVCIDRWDDREADREDPEEAYA